MSARSIRERRGRVQRRLDAEESITEIAKAEGKDRATIYRDIEWLKRNGGPGAPAPTGAAGPNNERALTHGATSAKMLGPLVREHQAALRRDFDWLDDRRLNLLAHKLAAVDQASLWITVQGTVVKDEHGNTYPVVAERTKWISAAWRMLGELQTEAREREAAAKTPGLAAYVDSTYGQGDGVTDAEEVHPDPAAPEVPDPAEETDL